jgi:hypothetical protein
MLAERACLAAPWEGAVAAASNAEPFTAHLVALLPPFFGDEPQGAAFEEDADEEEDDINEAPRPDEEEDEDFSAYGYGAGYMYASDYGGTGYDDYW